MNKTSTVRVRVTEEEKKLLEERSIAITGRNNKSKLLRKIIRELAYLTPDLLEEDIKEFRVAVKNLTGISRNLNQITAKINAGIYKDDTLSSHKIDVLKDHVDEVNKTLKLYVKNTINRSSRMAENGE